MATMSDLLTGTARPIRDLEKQALEGRAGWIRHESWRQLFDFGSILRRSSALLWGRSLPPGVQAIMRFMEATLDASLPHVDVLASLVRPQAAMPESSLRTFRFGSGVPGVLGCSDMRGARAYLSPLMDSSTGVLAAMHVLSLSLFGLPGARLPTCSMGEFVANLSVSSRWAGGTSYETTALLWTAPLSATPLHHVGSLRRLWSAVALPGARRTHVCSLPTHSWLHGR
jgi:hypothetical protein